MAIITAALIGSGFTFGKSIFESLNKEPTPEEQKEKGRVWYKMLKDFVVNKVSSTQLANVWQNQLPFKQKATKKRFMAENIVGKPFSSIVTTLVAKINDELVKGKFPRITQEAILSGMGATGQTASSPAGLSTVNAGAVAPSFAASGLDDAAAKEGRIYFYVLGSMALIVGILVYMFWGKKKRGR